MLMINILTIGIGDPVHASRFTIRARPAPGRVPVQIILQ
jgi:hypothetical protein